MNKFNIWVYIIGAVIIALTANSISTHWASKDDKFSIWLLLLLLISPLVFISFGLVTSKVGLALSSGIVDSLLTIGSIAIGLILFREWSSISIYQYLGIALSIAGIILMQLHK